MIDSIQRAYVSFESALHKYSRMFCIRTATRLLRGLLATLSWTNIHLIIETYQEVQGPGNQVVVFLGSDLRYDDSEWIYCQHAYYCIQVCSAAAIA